MEATRKDSFEFITFSLVIMEQLEKSIVDITVMETVLVSFHPRWRQGWRKWLLPKPEFHLGEGYWAYRISWQKWYWLDKLGLRG